MEHKNGSAVHDRKGIADIFADFYAELYQSRHPDVVKDGAETDEEQIDEFTMAELDNVLKALKNKKAKDAKGVAAEMYKNSGHCLRRLLLHTLNDALGPHAVLPSEWRRNRIKAG